MSVRLEKYVQAASPLMSEMLVTNGVGCDGERNQVAKQLTSHCREKLLVRKQRPVPQTDTGSRGENPKVSERTLVKELGKMTP